MELLGHRVYISSAWIASAEVPKVIVGSLVSIFLWVLWCQFLILCILILLLSIFHSSFGHPLWSSGILFIFKTVSLCSQVGLELASILLPLSPEYWNYRFVPQLLAETVELCPLFLLVFLFCIAYVPVWCWGGTQAWTGWACVLLLRDASGPHRFYFWWDMTEIEISFWIQVLQIISHFWVKAFDDKFLILMYFTYQSLAMWWILSAVLNKPFCALRSEIYFHIFQIYDFTFPIEILLLEFDIYAC